MKPASSFPLLAVGAALVGLAQGSEFLVNTTADESYDGGDFVAEVSDGSGLSLREIVGIFNANGGTPLGGEDDGDIIRFDDRLFDPTAPVIVLTSELVIADDLVIDGAQPGLPGFAVLDGASATRLLRIDTTGAPGAVAVTLRNLTLRNGSAATSGGAMRLGDTDDVTLENVSITNCRAPSGGAVSNEGGTLALITCALRDNIANGLPTGSGGALYNATGGTITVEGTVFADNCANTAGGAIEDQSNGTQGFAVSLRSVLLSGNKAGVAPAVPSPGDGGAVHVTGTGSVLLENCIATGNFAARQGGALWNGAGTMDLLATNLNNNAANGDTAQDGGGGIFNDTGTLEFRRVTISVNNAGGQFGSGGGIFSRAGTINLSDCTIESNTANRAGGGIEIVEGSATLSDVTLGGTTSASGNVAGFPGSATPGNGGGLHLTGAATVVIEGGSLVGSNSAEQEGGGLWNSATGSLTINGNSQILDNFAFGPNPDDGGGGIFNNGGLVEINADGGPVTISRNEAQGPSGSGGGIFNANGGTVIIEEATISQNVALRAGGGIEDSSGPGLGMTLTNVQLIDNRATTAPGNGGGLHVTGAGDVTFIGGHVSDNIAAEEGGGLWNGTGTLTLQSSQIRRNIANGEGADQGGGGLFNNGGTVTIEVGTSIVENRADGTAGSGGGIFNNTGGTVTANLATLSNNAAQRAGGGIEDNSGPGIGITLIGCEINDNQAQGSPGNGGGLHVSGDGSVQISGGKFAGNSAEQEGGGLWNGSGTMTLSAAMIENNTARGTLANHGGAGIFNNGGTLTVSATSLRGNDAAGSGGAVMSFGGDVDISNSSLTSNSAQRTGGGLCQHGGILILDSVSVGGADPTKGNSAVSPVGTGGGLSFLGGSIILIEGGSVRFNSAAQDGGGLWIGPDAMVGLQGSTLIADNEAAGDLADQGGGGIFNSGGSLETLDSGGPVIITNNHATGAAGSGGGIFNSIDGVLAIGPAEISRNSARRAGGGIEDTSGGPGRRVNLTDVSLTDNRAGPSPGNGGGLHITGTGGATIIQCTVRGNLATAEGGGLWNGSGEMEIIGGSITGNAADGDGADQGGGGVFNDAGRVLLALVDVSGNTAGGTSGSGGGVFVGSFARLTVMDSTIARNTANRAGGGVEVRNDAEVTFSRSLLTGNVAGPPATANPGNGGAVHITGDGIVDFFASCLSDNTAANEGGACTTDESGEFDATGSTITGNRAIRGGGFYLPDEDTGVDLINSTVSGNSARDGGGIGMADGRLSLLHATIAENSADIRGGGIQIGTGLGFEGRVLITNSIIAGNTAPDGPDIKGAIDQALASLLQDPSGSAGIADGANENIVGVDPLLTFLVDNGGPCPTHRPAHHSPAVNAGNNAATTAAALPFDQRGTGFPRVQGGSVDMGALEGRTLTYADWAADPSVFTAATPLEERDPEDDPDRDRIPNALEWFTGLDPERREAEPVVVTAGNGNLTLTFPRRKDIPPGRGALETSTNLQLFTPVPNPTQSAVNLDALREQITLEFALGNESVLFGRLRVQAN